MNDEYEDADRFPGHVDGVPGRHAAAGRAGSVARAVASAFAVFGLVGAGVVALNVVAKPPVPEGAPEPGASESPSTKPLTPDEIFLSWGPSEGDYARATQTAQALTVEEAAGQVIVASFSGRKASELSALVSKYHLGGVIFLDGNVGNQQQTERLTAAAQAPVDGVTRDWPVMVAVDQEGGSVARLGKLTQEMPSYMAAGAVQDKTVVTQAYAGYGADIVSLGFNVDFAPVADVTIGLKEPTIRSRSAGSNPDNVGRTVAATVMGYLDAGLIPTVKHFPGHGSVEQDSHSTLPVQNRKLEELAEKDFLPFQDAIDAGVPMVMMAHIQVKQWGSEPSSLNPTAYSYLRDEMGFEGVIVTDALNMAGVTRGRTDGEIAVAALNAGADVLLMPRDVDAAYHAIIDAVADGTLSRERLDEAAARSIALMRWRESIDPAVDAPDDYAKALTLAAVTVVTPLCGQPMVGGTVSISGGWSSERDALAEALKTYGVREGSGGTTIQLVGPDDAVGDADVVVTLAGPWGLKGSDASSYVALYGRGQPSLAALADVLAGTANPTGQFPTRVSDLPSDACGAPESSPSPQ